MTLFVLGQVYYFSDEKRLLAGQFSAKNRKNANIYIYMTTHQAYGTDVKGIAYDIGTVCDKKKARRSTIVEYFGVQDGVIADVSYY